MNNKIKFKKKKNHLLISLIGDAILMDKKNVNGFINILTGL